jgi:predicted nucleotidyltransferase component of viral defense system
MDKDKKRKAASVHQKLLNRARETNRPFNELLQYYAMERFLYRVSRSEYVDQFILKGALLLRTSGISEIRSTRDIDFMSMDDAGIEKMKDVIADCCNVQVPEDGLEFESNDIEADEIRENQVYQGYRFRVRGKLGNAKIYIQIDMGFGDIITPGPIWVEFPTVLDEENPRILAYTLETAIAEKYQAMIDLDLLNSRMKDFYDVWFLSSNLEFDGAIVQKAIEQTFERRRTELPSEKPVVFKELFYADKNKAIQWKTFKKKIEQEDFPSDLQTMIEQAEKFLWPPTERIIQGVNFTKKWAPNEGWK